MPGKRREEVSELHVSPDVLRLNPGLAKEVSTVPASKYHNVRAEAKGLRFQSGHEAAEVSKLILLDERHQGVFGLRLQVKFPLQGGNSYTADAVYLDDKLHAHVVDAKGVRTKEYRIKKKLFEERYYPHRIEEI